MTRSSSRFERSPRVFFFAGVALSAVVSDSSSLELEPELVLELLDRVERAAVVRLRALVDLLTILLCPPIRLGTRAEPIPCVKRVARWRSDQISGVMYSGLTGWRVVLQKAVSSVVAHHG